MIYFYLYSQADIYMYTISIHPYLPRVFSTFFFHLYQNILLLTSSNETKLICFSFACCRHVRLQTFYYRMIYFYFIITLVLTTFLLQILNLLKKIEFQFFLLTKTSNPVLLSPEIASVCKILSSQSQLMFGRVSIRRFTL